MADEGKIKQTIELAGEKEYSAALKEANRNLKTLRSELKAETAELGANATAQAKNEVKVRSLKKQIAEQEKVVETLRKALNEVKEKYGDNSEEVAKWEQKLNNARYSLADMNNKLQQTQDDLKKNADAVKESGEAYDDAADKATEFANATDSAGATANAVTFSSVMGAADRLTDKLKGAIDFITQVGKAAWGWMSDSGAWADELNTQSEKWGIDKETLQGWRYAATFIDTDVETIAKAFTKLTNRSDSTNKKLKELKIVADKGVGAKDLFWEVIEAMEGMDDVARENAANEIFGKSFQDLLPLIKAGREEWDAYVEEAREKGYILSDEQVEQLGTFDDANMRLQASFEAMKNTVAAELAPAFTTIADSLADLINSFTEWSRTEEGQKTLADLGNAIDQLVSSFVGEQNFTGIVEGAAGAIRGLTDALGWITTNWSTVETGLKAIGLGFAGITVGKEVLSALMLIKGINWFTVGNKTPPTTNPTPVGGPAPSPTGGGALVGLANGIKGVLGKGLSVIGAAGSLPGVVADMFLNQTNIGRAMRDGGDVLEGAKQDLAEKTLEIANNAATFLDDWKGVGDEILKTPVMQGALKQGSNTIRFWDGLYNDAREGLAQFWEDLTRYEEYTPGEEQAITGFRFSPEQIEAAQQYWDEYRSGGDGGEGLDKLTELIPDEDVFNALLDKIETFAGINETIEDLPAQWFDDVLDAVSWEENSGDQLSSEDVSGFAALPEQIKQFAKAGIVEGASGLSITMDGYSVGQVTAPYVSQIIASQMA